jgi:hypothetical protein
LSNIRRLFWFSLNISWKTINSSRCWHLLKPCVKYNTLSTSTDFSQKNLFFFIATAWEVSLVFEKPVRLRTCPHADNVLKNMLLRKCFSKIVTRIFFKHQSLFSPNRWAAKKSWYSGRNRKKLSAKRKSPVDRKLIFYLSVLFNFIFIKNSRGLILKKSTKDCRTLCKPLISRQVFLSCHGKKIEQNDSLPMTFNVV